MITYRCMANFNRNVEDSGGSRGGAGGPGPRSLLPLSFWVRKEEMTERRRGSRASKIDPGHLLSLKPGSATVYHSPFTWLFVIYLSILFS